MIVSLSKEEVRLCADMALNRWMMKWGSTDRKNYAGKNKKDMEPEIVANIRSIAAEYAVAKLYKLPHVLPFYPNNEHPYRKDFPDVLPNLEVRTVRTQDAFPVFEKDKNKGFILVGTVVTDSDFFSEVDVYGWIPVNECFTEEFFRPTESQLRGEKIWRIPKEAFNSSMLE